MALTSDESAPSSLGHERRSFFGARRQSSQAFSRLCSRSRPDRACCSTHCDVADKSAAGGDGEMAGYSRICPLDALPADGMPHQFVVTADITDAWSQTRGQRVGLVFLQREDKVGKPEISAFTAACPHLGCAVEFDASDDQYECPCHVSGFGKDGRKLFGPSLRDLDALDFKLVEKNGIQEVWVAFQQFRAGVAERIPVG